MTAASADAIVGGFTDAQRPVCGGTPGVIRPDCKQVLPKPTLEELERTTNKRRRGKLNTPTEPEDLQKYKLRLLCPHCHVLSAVVERVKDEKDDKCYRYTLHCGHTRGAAIEANKNALRVNECNHGCNPLAEPAVKWAATIFKCDEATAAVPLQAAKESLYKKCR